jgi:phosphate transport system permease protein
MTTSLVGRGVAKAFGTAVGARRLRDNRWPILAALIIVLLFIASGLSPLLGILGLVVFAIALLASGTSPAEKTDWSQLQTVIDALPDPVIALDPAGIVVALNDKTRTIAPALRAQLPVSVALGTPALVEAIQRAIATGKAQRAEFSETMRADHCYDVHVIPVSLAAGPRGSPRLLLLTFHDLTAHRRIEQMRADFVANASHELRTPLAALSGFIDTLQGPARNDPDARERFLDIMQSQARRMARLIDDLLSLSRIELSEHINPNTQAELGPVIRQVIDILQTVAQERGVEVTVAAPAEPIFVRGDRDELISVFENLVENALKYGASGKRVDIRVETVAGQDAGGGEAQISVRDYGPGIAPEHLPRLTERFYRVDVGLSRAEGGTGLGLALVKHIVNRHRGRLTIESTPGEGSTFTVNLPLAASQNPDAKVLQRLRAGDTAFRLLTLAAATTVLALLGGVMVALLAGALPALRAFGGGFLISQRWNPVTEQFGALAPIYGTLVTSLIAMAIAVPIGLGIAMFLSEICPLCLRRPLGIIIELLAGIPSIIYGIWGLFVLAPFLQSTVQPVLIDAFSDVPILANLFAGPPYGIGILTAGLILAIMVLPFIASVSRDVFQLVPPMLKEAAYGVGATTWEVFRHVVAPYARAGVIGAVLLGLGRALGETMAVTFVIGNAHRISSSLFAPGTTISATIANEFTEAVGDLYTSALIALALVLFVITFIVLAAARLLLLRVERQAGH